MSEFRGEMKSLVQTYVELLYPDDSDMQAALFENITVLRHALHAVDALPELCLGEGVPGGSELAAARAPRGCIITGAPGGVPRVLS